MIDSGGFAVKPMPYGRELTKPERLQSATEIVLEPGETTEADIPPGSCEAFGGGRIISNEIVVKVR